MNLANKLSNINDNLSAITAETFFLAYNFFYDINALLFNASEFICNYTKAISMVITIALISYELYVLALTITIATLVTILLTSALIFPAINYILAISSKARRGYYNDSHIAKINSLQAGLRHNYFIKNLAILIILVAFILIVAPPLVKFILPIATFILKDAVFVLTTIANWLFYSGNCFLSATQSTAKYGNSNELYFIIIIAFMFYAAGLIPAILASIISYVGHANAMLFLTNFMVIAPVFYSMLKAYSATEDQNIVISNTTISIKYHSMLQLGLVARVATTLMTSATFFKLAGPTLMTLIAPYATYILVLAGVIPLAMMIYNHTNDNLKAFCLAIIYAIATFYLITQNSVAFILAPQLLSIFLALGAGVIATQILFLTTSFIANQAIDKAFKPDSTVTAMRLKYSEFISNMKYPVAMPIKPTIAAKDLAGEPAFEAIAEEVPAITIVA
jgi:hypothetical protein